MKQKLLCIALAALLIPAAGNVLAQAKSTAMKLTDNGVKIGVLTDMSGVYSDLGGQGAVTAVQMAIDDYKAQYKPKFNIEMVYADHQNKADVGSNKVREWYDTQGVDMVTDVLNSGVALAVAKVTQEKKRVLMVVGAGSTRLTDQDCTPNTVHYAYDTFSLANVAGKAIVRNGGDTWFFLTADYAFGQSLESDATNVIKANGGKVLGSVRHPLNASDFSSYLLQAQASKAKIIGLANAGGDTINAIKAASEFGITKKQNLAGLLMFITDIHALGLQTTQGMLLTSGFYWDKDDATRAFSKRYFAKTKRMPTMVQAGDYSAVTTYLKAVQAAGTDEAAAVMNKMKATPVNDFFAKNGTIRGDGRMIHDMYLMQVKKPSESKYPWDYYDIKGVVPGNEAFQSLSVSHCPLVKK